MGKIRINCLLLVCLAAWSHGIDKSDEAFENYLKTTMEAYPAWLAENNLDPTTVQSTLVIESESASNVFLRCELNEQRMIGHSKNSQQTLQPTSAFASHMFGVTRSLRDPYWLIGNFTCSGKLNTPEENAFFFKGTGTYMLQTNTSDEAITFENVGVSQDHKLNLNLLEFGYALDLRFARRVLGAAIWNDSRAGNEFGQDVEQEFQDTYSRYLRSPLANGIKELHPSLPLIYSYLSNKTRDLDLKTIMDATDLPTPYLPGPDPTTTESNPTTSSSIVTETSTKSSQPTSAEIIDTSTESNQTTGSGGVTGTSVQTTTEAETTTSWANKPVNIGVGTMLAIMLLVTLLN